MESPEADEAFLAKFGTKVDDFFSRIPLPEDPMKAALARSPEELEEVASAELVKEAVREAYLRRLGAKQTEELRLKRAAKRLDKGTTAGEYFERTDAGANSVAADAANDVLDDEKIRKQLAEMKEKVRLLEHLLSSSGKTH